MSISSLVTAALPIPVTSLKLIPTYAFQTGVLSVYTSLFCFLLLGFIFYSRHSLARVMFPQYVYSTESILTIQTTWLRWRIAQGNFIQTLPLILIISSALCVFLYHRQLQASVIQATETFEQRTATIMASEMGSASLSSIEQLPPLQFAATEKVKQQIAACKANSFSQCILDSMGEEYVGDASTLMMLYVLIFAAAESAFILMAIKEYLQDLLRLDERTLIYRPEPPAEKALDFPLTHDDG